MSEKYIQANRDQMSLLPYDLREWIPEDDIVHFVIEAVESIEVSKFRVNERGTGSEQYHPHLMLSLLIYCYANGVFGSRRIERASYRDVAVRYICANTHPDHDTICKFRRENFEAVAGAFLSVLQLARELHLLKVGTISIDGTKISASASKDKNVRYDRAIALEQQLQHDIADLLQQAERADTQEEIDGQRLPHEINRRHKLLEKMQKARQRLEQQAKHRAATEQKEFERKLAAREERKGRHKAKPPHAPNDVPRDNEQTNLTDADSRLMRKNKRSGYMQAYSAQAAVDADGSMLILGSRVTQCASDRNEMVADVEAIPQAIGTAEEVLADNGYASEEQVSELEARGINVLVSVHAEAMSHRRRYDFRPVNDTVVSKTGNAPLSKEWIKRMRCKMQTEAARKRYRLRKQTVEPVFGLIKQAMGFRQFLLRGVEKVQGEWLLVATAYNFRRLHALMRA